MQIVIGIIFVVLMNRISGWFNFNIETYITILIIIFIYSLLPDTDHKMSHITWIFLGVGIAGAFYGSFYNSLILYFSLGLLTLTFVAAKLLKHRGIIHTVWMGALTSTPLWFILGKEYMFLAFVVFYSHLLGDGYFFKLD